MTSVGVGSRRELNKLATRQAIVDAALKLLREGHGNEMTATQIAETAGISRRTLFNYFPTVDAIMSYPVHAVLEHMVEALTPLAEHLPLMEAVVEALKSDHSAQLLAQMAHFGAHSKQGDPSDCYPSDLMAWQNAISDVIERIDARYPHADRYSIRVFTHAILGAGQAAFKEWIERLPAPDASGLYVSDEVIADFYTLITRAMETLNAGFNSLPLTATHSSQED